MRVFFCNFLFLIMSPIRATAKASTDVVSHAFCESSVPAEDRRGKNTLEEVHTFAELKRDHRATLPDSFTVCSSMMTNSCPKSTWPTFFTMLDNDRRQFLAPILNTESMESILRIYFLEGATEQVNQKIPPLFPNQWIRSCTAVNTTSGQIHWVVEGTLVQTLRSEELANSKRRPMDLSKKIVLGAKSYARIWYALSQKVTNLNIFSTPLTIEKMKSMTGEESCVEEGDYLAWADMEWILHGQAKMETVDQEEPCKGEPYVNLFYTQFPSMEACMHHCENLGTRVPSVNTFQDWATLQHSLKMELYDKGLDTMNLWLPLEDRKKEGEWKDFHTGKVIQNSAMESYNLPWAGSGPDGGVAQNCAYLLDAETWGDVKCDSHFYACMCAHKPHSYLEFKGLCPNSAIDRYYKLSSNSMDSRKLELQGLKRTLITYDDEKQIWVINVTDSNVTGISRASQASFTLGKHNWTIRGDKGCNVGKSHVTELKMSGCSDDKFTCNDGQCVRMDLRCNQLPDCRDKSDERNCDILVLEDGYNKKVPPINSSELVSVFVSIDLMKIVDIDEDDYSIGIQFKISLRWRENRATYQNLKSRESLNALAKKDIENVWLPKVVYENTDQKVTTRLGEIGNGEWETKVVVVREEGNGTRSGLRTLDETMIFKGSLNSLIMSQTYTHTFQCVYELSAYPFDTQVVLVNNILMAVFHIFFFRYAP